jgi:hypothetical protein
VLRGYTRVGCVDWHQSTVFRICVFNSSTAHSRPHSTANRDHAHGSQGPTRVVEASPPSFRSSFNLSASPFGLSKDEPQLPHFSLVCHSTIWNKNILFAKSETHCTVSRKNETDRSSQAVDRQTLCDSHHLGLTQWYNDVGDGEVLILSRKKF